jgi:hypothetical protein
MRRLLLTIVCFLTFSHFAYSDRSGYDKTVNISVESENYRMEHYHDWSIDYAYIECINKNTNVAVFRISSPALTNLYISYDEKYIVGLSNIKLRNPYQLIILTIEGEYIKQRRISYGEAKLNQNELNSFSEKFSEQYIYLEAMNRIYNVGTYYYIDYLDCQFIDEEAWRYLYPYLTNNHLSDNFSESVTNYVFWFNESNVEIEYIYENNELLGISLLDKGIGLYNKRIIITINE